jgi:membrane-associated HD superfamily phosphohydrolase
MFWNKELKKLLKETKELFGNAVEEAGKQVTDLSKDVATLKKEKQDLTEQVEKLKLDAKIADEDIKHMVKMKEERLELDHQKKIAAVEKEKADAIADVKDKFRDKMEEQLAKESANIKEMYGEILKRLPDVNVALGNAFKDKDKE